MFKEKLVGYVGTLISFLITVSTVSAKEKIDTDLEELLSYDIEDIAVWVASKRKE
jgi:hypothetical protein